MTGHRGTIVFDLDGVLYLDDVGIAGAGNALEALVSERWKLLFATNNSTKTSEDVARHIAERTGFPASPEAAVTSAAAAASHAAGRFTSAYVVGSIALRTTLETSGVEIVPAANAECVVVGLDRNLTYDIIDAAARAIRGGAAFIATNIDATYPTPTGLAPGAGSVVAAVATAAGTQPMICGKPTPIFRALVRSRLEGPETWMIGDRPETDTAMAIAERWQSVLVLTGVVSDPSDVPSEFTSDHVIASVAHLPDLIAKESTTTPEPR